MPGDHSEREKRQAEKIKRSYLMRGKISAEEAERRAWATVNKARHGLSSLKGK